MAGLDQVTSKAYLFDARDNGIYISGYDIPDAKPIGRVFIPENVYLTDGALNMKVDSYSGSGLIRSSEIATVDTFQYASVRTVLKSSKTAGVCEGNFFYGNPASR